MAHQYQSIRGGDDAVCGGMRWAVSADAPGPGAEVLLHPALSEHDEPLAAVSQPAGVGCVCGGDVFDDLAAVLVHRAGSRSGDVAGSIQQWRRAMDLWNSGDGLARIGDA